MKEISHQNTVFLVSLVRATCPPHELLYLTTLNNQTGSVTYLASYPISNGSFSEA
jgi:hypothetical protein